MYILNSIANFRKKTNSCFSKKIFFFLLGIWADLWEAEQIFILLNIYVIRLQFVNAFDIQRGFLTSTYLDTYKPNTGESFQNE